MRGRSDQRVRPRLLGRARHPRRLRGEPRRAATSCSARRRARRPASLDRLVAAEELTLRRPPAARYRWPTRTAPSAASTRRRAWPSTSTAVSTCSTPGRRSSSDTTRAPRRSRRCRASAARAPSRGSSQTRTESRSPAARRPPTSPTRATAGSRPFRSRASLCAPCGRVPRRRRDRGRHAGRAGRHGPGVWEPWDVAAGLHGHVFVTDRENGVVHVLAADGHCGLVPGVQLDRPTHLAVDREGRLYVIEEGADDVVAIAPDGSSVERIDAPERLAGASARPGSPSTTTARSASARSRSTAAGTRSSSTAAGASARSTARRPSNRRARSSQGRWTAGSTAASGTGSPST